MEKPMRWKGVLAITLIIIVVAAIAVFRIERSDQPQEIETVLAPTVDVDTISVDTGFGWVSAEGMVVPLREAPLSVPSSGQVAEIAVGEGDRVSEGDPLLRLEAVEQENALQQARANLSLAEAGLESAQAELAAAQGEKTLAELGVEAAGAQLAYLEAGPTDEQIAVAESGVNAAEAGISAAAGNQALVLEGTQPTQLLAAESQLVLAQVSEKEVRDALFDAKGDEKTRLEDQLLAAVTNVNAAQAALAELQGGPSQSERLSAGSAVAAAIARRDEAQAQLELLRSGATEEALEVARAEVQQAEAKLVRAELASARAEVAVAQAQSGIQQAETDVVAAQIALNQMTLEAPFDGAVANIAYRPGEVASPGVAAVEVVDFDGWLVETTDLNEQDVVALAVGFPAEIRLDALPGETLTGTVTKISPASNVVAGDVRYTVTIRLDDTGDLPLRWGMTTLVDIEVE
jgi:multidrug resistance efflux pump